MIYVRICWAAICRYRIEKPIRAMWVDIQPTMKRRKMRTSKRLPFPTIVSALVSRGLIDPNHQSLLMREYNRHSQLLHGEPE